MSVHCATVDIMDLRQAKSWIAKSPWIRRKALPLVALIAFGFCSVVVLQLSTNGGGSGRLGRALGAVPVLVLEQKPLVSGAVPQKASPKQLVTGRAVEGDGVSQVDSGKRHIYFLKTHKCASTTLQRVLLTYALKRNLSIALPLKGRNNFFPQPYRPELSKRTCTHPRVDVMAAHARYNASASMYMPNDTFFLSIVRDPANHMDSVFDYFLIRRCPRFYAARTSFGEYMDTLVRTNPKPYQSVLESACHFDQLRSLQLYDFGLDLVPPPTREDIEAKIKEIDTRFHLVLIAERLDESLIVLRDQLGWSTSDIVYLKSNFRVGSVQLIANKTRQQAYEWNWADKMLYDYFSVKMNATVQKQQDYIQSELDKFRQLQASFYNVCVSGIEVEKLPQESNTVMRLRNIVHSSGTAKKETPTYTTSYALSDEGKRNYTCQLAAMSELALFEHINVLNPPCNGSDADPSSGTSNPVMRKQPINVVRPSFVYRNGLSLMRRPGTRTR